MPSLTASLPHPPVHVARAELVRRLRERLERAQAQGGPDAWERSFLLDAARALAWNAVSPRSEAWLRYAATCLTAAEVAPESRWRTFPRPVSPEALERAIAGLQP